MRHILWFLFGLLAFPILVYLGTWAVFLLRSWWGLEGL